MTEQKIEFITTDKLEQLNISSEQEKNVSSLDKIQWALKQKNNIGWYVYLNQEKIGFILINQFAANSFFLWDFIIDKNFQNKGYGKETLIRLCHFLKNQFNGKIVTTTYIAGNQPAKKLYEGIGFQETDTANVNGVHEINLRLLL